MSNSFRKFGFLIALSFLLANSYSQVDSTKIAYSEERKDTSDYRYRRLYQYLDINLKNENFMLKLSPDFSLSRYNKQLGLQLSYEQKLYKQFSVLVTNRNIYHVQKSYSYSYMGSSSWDSKNSYFNSNLGAGLRWYFNLNQRIKNDVSGNNLSGLYAEAGLENIVSYSNGTAYQQSNTLFRMDNGFHVFQSFNPRVAVGFQRRLNNWSYFDIFTTANLTYGALYWDLNFRLGFAWGNNK